MPELRLHLHDLRNPCSPRRGSQSSQPRDWQLGPPGSRRPIPSPRLHSSQVLASLAAALAGPCFLHIDRLQASVQLLLAKVRSEGPAKNFQQPTSPWSTDLQNVMACSRALTMGFVLSQTSRSSKHAGASATARRGPTGCAAVGKSRQKVSTDSRVH